MSTPARRETTIGRKGATAYGLEPNRLLEAMTRVPPRGLALGSAEDHLHAAPRMSHGTSAFVRCDLWPSR